MHPLLTRQLKRLFGIPDEPKLTAALLELRRLADSDGLQEETRNLLGGLDRLLGQVDNTYQQHEADITLRDQSLEISSEEILQANEKLRRKERRQHAIIESLRHTANELLRSTHLPELSDDETSLEKLSLLMSDLVKERQQVQSKLERTLSELERQKSAIDQHAIVSITNTNGKVTYANEGFCRVSGFQRHELIGKKHPQFNQTDQSAATIKKIWSTIRHGHTWKGEFANRNKTGTPFWLDATIVPFLDTQGEPFQYIIICTDITERRIFQEQLKDAIHRAESANQAKSEFLANMSHEIRTPMNAIIGLSHLAIEGKTDQRQHEYLTKIQSSAKTLLSIINDILDFSKIEAGEMTLETVDFSLSELLEQVCTIFCFSAEQKSLEVVYSVAPDLPDRYIGDPLRLGQVLTNLASNAVKFTEQGEIVISVTAEESQQGKIRLRFDVSDTGIGLSEDKLTVLFDSFSQADSSTTRKFGGTGLGLAISKSLISMMEGEISVESTEGEGSNFYFTLPLQIDPERETPKNLQLHGARTMVVDDLEKSRDTILKTFRFHGANATGKACGETCIEELQRCCREEPTRPYQLTLIDWSMPGMDGLQLLRTIQSDPLIDPKPRIILMSKYNNDQAIRQTETRNTTLLTKPIIPTAFLNAVLKALGRPTLRIRHEATSVSSRDVENIQGILGAHILVAEDNPVNQQVTRALLEHYGLKVKIAEDGRAAIEALAKTRFDLVLMDVQMPDIDGYEASRIIRQDATYDEMPIIALTANAMSGDREESLAAGMDDYLPKPIEPDALYAMLIKWIQPGQTGHIFNEEYTSSAILLPEHLPGIDIEAGLKRMRGNQALFRDLLLRFRADYEHWSGRISIAILENNREEALHLAHALKGVTATIGAMDLSTAGTSLEKHLKTDMEDLTEIHNTVTDQLYQVLDGLKSLDKPPESATSRPVSTLDQQTLQTLLSSMKPLLVNGDLQALQLVEQLHEMVRGTEMVSTALELKKHVDAFDFEKALSTLESHSPSPQ